MEFAALRTYLAQKKGSTEEMPFGPDALVFKVMGKMYALVAFQATPLRITLKCEPEHALFLRDQYPAVQPGYYMNKQHWNTITLDGSIPPAEILSMIDASYTLVVKGLKKAERQQLEAMEG
ncbi:MAG: MmcQ/YjbR family DNA-binding protein [Chloroflexales bacterium]|nr:MmcQ/YjbR family DNA-binding protein [Chloroflexales bacterium]